MKKKKKNAEMLLILVRSKKGRQYNDCHGTGYDRYGIQTLQQSSTSNRDALTERKTKETETNKQKKFFISMLESGFGAK